MWRLPRYAFGVSLALMVLFVALIGVSSAGAARLPEFTVSPVNSPDVPVFIAGPVASGGVWFTGGGMVGRVTDQGDVLAQPVSFGSGSCGDGDLDSIPGSGTVAPDGDLWFTTAGRALGRAEPGRPPSLEACAPGRTGGAVAAGRYGDDVWFTQYSGVARFSQNTRRVTLPIKSGHPRVAYPRGLAIGRDGSVWFGEPGGAAPNLPVGVSGSLPSYLGRWANGRVTAFPVVIPGEPGSGPTGVVAGPDGRIWFATRFGVGASTLGGRIVFYRLDHERGRAAYRHQVGGLTAAADGNLWFIQGPDLVGRITPAGQVTRWHVQESYAEGIASGGGRAVWITADTGVDSPYQLTRLTIPPKSCRVPALRGLSPSRARRLAGLAHCLLGRVRASRAARRGRLVVVSQRPRAGSVRRPGRKIDVRLGAASGRHPR